MLIIAHRLSAVRHANRIIVMDKGRIVETGTHQALLARPQGPDGQGTYAHLWRMQDGMQPGEAQSATHDATQGDAS